MLISRLRFIFLIVSTNWFRLAGDAERAAAEPQNENCKKKKNSKELIGRLGGVSSL